ncbi:MAG: hypothetical protein QOJ10_88 [Chloroflexota bacterium]|nr:hypothetical protein [Chloroflexota bacterium]
MRGLLGAAIATLLVAACGSAIAPPVTGSGYKLYEAATTGSSSLVAVIDTRSGSIERTLPLGTMAGKHLYSVAALTLSDIDPVTGATLRELQLPGAFHLPQITANGLPGGLSQDGRWLVLINDSNMQTTQMLVVDTASMKAGTPMSFAGTFQFDAISNDGQRIYVVEYLSGSSYRVRVYNVVAGHLESYIVVDKSDASESMTGLRLSGVPSPDGQWLYSVYARPHQGAFIHALNLNQPYAFCLELPGSGYESSSDELQWSLALSAGGSRLFATNGAKGIVAEINTSGPSVVRTAHIDSPSPSGSLFVQNVEAKELGSGGAVLSSDGQTLVMTGKTGLIWVDTTTLHARSHQLAGWTVWSLGLSPDGRMVYALSDAEMIAELSMANPGVGSTFNASSALPLGLIRVDSPPAP